jgi:hypothetical protein
MPTETTKILQKIVSKAGWQNGLLTRQLNKKPQSSKFAFQYYIANNAFNDSTLDLDAIYFTDTTPVIYIKELKSYDPSVIIGLHKRFWNECRTPLTLIITPTIIKVLDNYAVPVNSPSEISRIEVKTFSTTEEDLERLAEILRQSKLDSEKVLGNEINLKTSQRVDKKLIKQLREARKQLHVRYNLNFSVIHDLLGRSLFTLYLEHRGILIEKEIKSITKISDSFFKLLQYYPKETYVLFSFLKEKFNGDLFPISEAELNAVENNPEILHLIYSCYSCTEDLQSGQLAFPFNLFDFKHIPIELISAIYEEFMSEEDIDNNRIESIKSKRELGAYYTPQMLVEFIYNEVLPMPSRNDYDYRFKILDPACGSGIFLVEGFKRIIERWKYSNKQTELTKETLSELLLNSIYGIEIHPEAIKITAFSLYLTFLHHMNPKEILREVQFSPLVFWTKKEEAEQREEKKFGANLLQANTFIREGETFKASPIEGVNNFFRNKFDFVIGNPPWKRSNVDDEILSWASEERWDLERDVIKGFLAYAPIIAPDANIALVASAKVLFNTSGTDDNFRLRFFTENKALVVANFSVVRHALFEKAKQAAALIIYKPRKQNKIEEDETILYCVPKTSGAIQNRNTITIDESEIKYLPIQEILKPDSKIFKIAMYGNLRDLKFINKLNSFPKISSVEHIEAVGLNNDAGTTKKGNPNLGNNIFIAPNFVKPYYIPKRNKPLFNQHLKFEILRTIKKDIFSPPLIAIKIGNDDVDICSAYVDYPCAFETYALSLRFPTKTSDYHKAFVCCLNSSLARYYYIQISGSWGIDRGRVQRNELLKFPLVTENFSEEVIGSLSKKLDEIIAIKNKEFSNKDAENIEINPVRKQIDRIIYDELKISKAEQALIDNVLCYSNVLKDNYKNSGAEKPVSISRDIKPYAQTYLDTINKQFTSTSIRLTCIVYPKATLKDELVCVKFIFQKSRLGNNEVQESDETISDILNEINESTFKENSSSIYYRRVIKYDLPQQNTFYLIKPNQKRFWSKAAALNDADSLVVEILNQHEN